MASRIPTWAAWLSSLLLAFFASAYAIRADATYAVTLWPAWFWLVPAAFLMLFIRGKRNLLMLITLWLVFALVFSEEWRSSLRLGEVPRPQNGIRVISLNCAAGEIRAAEEVIPLRPDIVLLQESPSLPELEKLRDNLFGPGAALLHGSDTSIIANGKLGDVIKQSQRGDFIFAEVVLPGKPPIFVCSLRLMPPILRFDLWNPGCWSEMAQSRKARREELQTIAKQTLESSGAPTIFGGDFNTTPDDGITASLRPILNDSFETAGRGWGGTGTNEYPVARVDQIWVSKHFQPIAVYAKQTLFSDHRMVICDIVLTR